MPRRSRSILGGYVYHVLNRFPENDSRPLYFLEVARLSSATEVNPHERYLAVFDLINRRNDEMADAFDDMRRSTALLRLACIQSHRLLSDDEFGRFSEATRHAIA
ncbi:MAG: hypothetical protein L0228_18905 [Planctomycetes bacterium]|nr:hypothetical protein [Planctomycetota bacterium]